MSENRNALSSGIAHYACVQECLHGHQCWTASLFNI